MFEEIPSVSTLAKHPFDDATNQDPLCGRERIAIFAPSGRPMRMGDTTELAVSNYDRVRQALAAGELDKAAEYAALQFESNAAMMATYLQWPCAHLLAAAEHLGAPAVRTLATAAFEHWREAVRSLAAQGATERLVVSKAAPLLHPDLLTLPFAQGVIDAFRCGQSPDYALTAMKMLVDCEARLTKSLAEANVAEARLAYDAYFSCTRSWHDVLMQYADSFPCAAAARHGQAAAEALVAASFNLAPFGAGLWDFGSGLSPRDLAAFLLAHIRDHHSGPERKGAAVLREHEDRYELIFDPCGSGGAMRRRLGSAQTRLPAATPATFQRKNEVPPYCTHCAANARTAIARFGWPIYVTRFDPDPAKPCGWTIYKTPDAVPDRYFEEVGQTKAPRMFRRSYWMGEGNPPPVGRPNQNG